jgi:hypothetical protein
MNEKSQGNKEETIFRREKRKRIENHYRTSKKHGKTGRQCREK